MTFSLNGKEISLMKMNTYLLYFIVFFIVVLFFTLKNLQWPIFWGILNNWNSFKIVQYTCNWVFLKFENITNKLTLWKVKYCLLRAMWLKRYKEFGFEHHFVKFRNISVRMFRFHFFPNSTKLWFNLTENQVMLTLKHA